MAEQRGSLDNQPADYCRLLRKNTYNGRSIIRSRQRHSNDAAVVVPLQEAVELKQTMAAFDNRSVATALAQ